MSFVFSFFFFFTYLFFTFLFFYSFFFNTFVYDFFLFDFMGIDFSFTFIFDFVSLGFFSCVSFISFVVFLYSVFYMSIFLDSRRFYSLVFLFVISMFFLVFSGNFLVVMVGWDGLGLISFCLVIFYSNSSSLESGLVTVFSNRIGDVFFLLSFFLFFSSGTFSFLPCFYKGGFFFLCIVLGALTKSAQVPFSAWLPMAMAAPTPVSSLVHSSTLVTAGVFVLIRFNYIFFFINFFFFKFIFVFTMVVAGIIGVFECDFKKIVAMSTLSQLGMMMFTLSLGMWVISFVHMILHAFFKSLLFMSVGSFMNHLGGCQDSRFYGSFFSSYSSFLYFSVSCFCLAGFPFFIGFYSKDSIILSSSYAEGFFLYVLFCVGCVFTVCYSFRLVYLSYFFGFRTNSYISFSESVFFFIPLSFLFFKCWIIGGLFYWFYFTPCVLFFSFFDLFFGMFIIFVGLFFYFSFRLTYIFLFFFYSILYMRWGASSISFSFIRGFSHFKHESTWVEFLGGKGLYFFLYKSSVFFNVGFYFISFLMISFFSLFWFF